MTKQELVEFIATEANMSKAEASKSIRCNTCWYY